MEDSVPLAAAGAPPSRQEVIDDLINEIRLAEEEGSVTAEMVAEIFDFLSTGHKSGVKTLGEHWETLQQHGEAIGNHGTHIERIVADIKWLQEKRSEDRGLINEHWETLQQHGDAIANHRERLAANAEKAEANAQRIEAVYEGLQDLINDEAGDRERADAEIRERLATEANERSQTDDAIEQRITRVNEGLQDLINDEVGDRERADAETRKMIVVEMNERAQADEALSYGKQDKIRVTPDLELSADGLLGVADMAKRRLFIDLWNNLAGSMGQYNEETDFFELNGITDIDWDEAYRIYNMHSSRSQLTEFCSCYGSKMRTLFWFDASWQGTMSRAFQQNSSIEVWRGAIVIGAGNRMDQAFYMCGNLRVVDRIRTLSNSATAAFLKCPKLETCKISGVLGNMELQDCPRLSLESFQYMISGQTNASATTWRVHADIYAKITDETNTEWHALLALAEIKKITFAC